MSRSRKLTRQHRRTASHEAGHTCAALLQGKRFNAVWVEERNDKEYLGMFDEPVGSWTLDELGIGLMAGLAGERLELGRKCGRLTEKDYNAGAYNDVDEIARYVVGDTTRIQTNPVRWMDGKMIVNPFNGSCYAAATPLFVNDCLRKAYALLSQNRALHTHLTDELVRRGRVSYMECIKIFEQEQTRHTATVQEQAVEAAEVTA